MYPSHPISMGKQIYSAEWIHLLTHSLTHSLILSILFNTSSKKTGCSFLLTPSLFSKVSEKQVSQPANEYNMIALYM